MPSFSSLSKCFKSSKFEPMTKDKSGAPTTIVPSPIGTWKTTCFFLDSSGRSSFSLPLQLTFPSKDDLEAFLAADCLDPPPTQQGKEKEEGGGEEGKQQQKEAYPMSLSSIGFEVKSYPVDELKSVVVEAISVVSTSVHEETVFFDTDVVVRASSKNWISSDSIPTSPSEPAKNLDVKVNLEITPVLSEKSGITQEKKYALPDLSALEFGAIPDHMQQESVVSVQETRLTTIGLDVTLTHAFGISVTSFNGPNLGNTLVSLTISHSNTHKEPVTITNVALHPGHSRQETPRSRNRAAGGQHTVTNMTRSVQWKYAPKTELDLPLLLKPHDAFSTVILVNAGEEMRSRSFVSPVSVTGIVCNNDSSADESQKAAQRRQRLVVAADSQWMTGLVAIEPADAFRITMTVERTEYIVGEPMVVSLRIFNLSLESHDLMLLMAKEEHLRSTPKDEAVNTAVVAEVNGYTFGVWGIAGEDDGTVRLNRDHELLAVDAALLLGEVMGQHCCDAELRFIPLQEGTLSVPNFKLYDKSVGKWYNCIHRQKIVAVKKK